MVNSIKSWDGTKVINRNDAFICGDAISDLRTSDNNLSVWVADTIADINDAIVAITLNRDNVSKLGYFLLDEEDLKNLEISVSNKQIGVAKGLDKQILQKHRNLTEMDYWRIGFLAEYMIKLACGNEYNYRTVKEIKTLLESYKKANKINLEEMKDKLKENLKW